MTYPVKWFDFQMQGAPQHQQGAGKIIAILDACLITGFGSTTLDSLVIADGIATATISAGHAFKEYSVLLIEGASPVAVTGEKRVLSTTGTTFTFDATGIPAQTASGTITAKLAPVGWAKEFAGTNKAVYARTDPAATAMVLRLDDTPNTWCLSQMFEEMTDVDTGTGRSPPVADIYTGKRGDASLGKWRLFADDRMFYLFVDNNNVWGSGLAFGDLDSFKAGDAFGTLIAGGSSTNHGLYLTDFNGNTENCWIARKYTQVGAGVVAARWSHRRIPYSGYGGMAACPNPVSNDMHAWPVDVWENNEYPRGMLPGLFCPLHGSNTGYNLLVKNERSTGRAFYLQATWALNRTCAMDLDGPWR